MVWRDVRPLVTSEEAAYSFLDPSVSMSPYYHRAFQGATLNPHTLWFVELDTSKSLNVSRPYVMTSEEAYKLCKEEKWKLRINGLVDRQFLFVTVLSDDILPFFIRGTTLTVLPVAVEEDRYVLMDHEAILSHGFEGASDWTQQAETIFAGRSKDQAMTAQDRLDYQHLLTLQNPNAPFIVLYNKSGTNISCAVLTREQSAHYSDLEVGGFVAESVTYRIYTSTEEEALYLVGVLNSTVVNDAIKPYQTEGVYHGKRDIHRRPFEVCPIEEFDPTSAAHQEIVNLARLGREKMGRAAGSLTGSLAKVRERSRELLQEEIARIDEIVGESFRLMVPPLLEEADTKEKQAGLF